MHFPTNSDELSEQECTQLGCLWQPSTTANVPSCILDPSQHGYTLDASSLVKNEHGLQASLKIKPKTKQLALAKNHVELVKFSAEYLTDKIVRLRLTDPKNKRYEVPAQSHFNVAALGQASENVIKYNVELNGDFNLTISRKEGNTKM